MKSTESPSPTTRNQHIRRSCIHVIFDSEIRLTISSDGVEPNMIYLKEALSRIFYSVARLSNLGFQVLTRRSRACSCFPAILFYCTDKVEPKPNSAVHHGLYIMRPSHRFLPRQKNSKQCLLGFLRTILQDALVRRLVGNRRK